MARRSDGGAPSGEVEAIVESEGRLLRVLSPAVGIWSDLPAAGARLESGGVIGSIRILNRRVALRLPPEKGGIARRLASDRRRLAVEYGQTLLVLGAARPGAAGPPAASGAGEGNAAAALPQGARAIVAPTDGVFYSRPAPDQPPFTAAGARLRVGQPVGLVEVMKTFNQILYEGAGAPVEVEVLEVRPAEGEEVRSGQVLVVVREVE